MNIPPPGSVLAATSDNPFGKVDAPVSGLDVAPEQGLGKLFSLGIGYVLLVAALLVLVYLLWGALDWITSGGEKDKVAKAQLKITHAVIGILVVVASFTVFTVITGSLFGTSIIQSTGSGWTFKLPQFGP